MNAPRFIVAITGGIAAGKTAVSRHFEQLGIAVADADAFARALVEPGQPALEAIAKRFGSGVLQTDGRLDRSALRQLVFDDQHARHELQSILHPGIRIALRDACVAASSAYAMAAIPLLTEGGARNAYPWLTRILLVDVPREVQLDRLLRRDCISAEQAGLILAAQATREQRLAVADDVIDNSGALDGLASQVRTLHALYLSQAAATQ
jgi:dephospho-CoA kinase